MPVSRPFGLAAYIVLLGVLTCLGWMFMGQTDDAPGAGMIGIAGLLSSIVVAVQLVRRRTTRG